MASTKQSAVRRIARGIDRSQQQHLADPASCYDMLNLKPVRGRLEQTSWMQLGIQYSKITGESADSRVHCIISRNRTGSGSVFYTLNEYVAKSGAYDPASGAYSAGTGLLCVVQTKRPADNTVTGECLIWGFENSTTYLINAGDKITVKTTAASTFAISTNGGAYGGNITISADDSTGLDGFVHVGFQGQGATTDFVNFPIGSIWEWTAQSTIPNPAADIYHIADQLQYTYDSYNSDIYVGGPGRQIMRIRSSGGSGTIANRTMISWVGYSQAYGYHVCVFQNHLFVSQYAPAFNNAGVVTDSFNYTNPVTPWTLGYSHLNNPDQFYKTLINEADTYVVPQQRPCPFSYQGITGLVAWRGLLYVFLANSITTGQYVGLPNVMQFTPLNSNVGSISMAGVVRTPQGIYFIGQDDFYVIKLYEPTAIGAKIRDYFFNDMYIPDGTPYVKLPFGHYHPLLKEVCWTYWSKTQSGGNYQQRQVVYCERTDDWYIRNVPCTYSGQSYDLLCAVPIPQSMDQFAYGGLNSILQDMPSTLTGPSGNTALKDTQVASVAAYTTPYFVSQYMPNPKPFYEKEGDTLFLDAYQPAANGGGIQVAVAGSDIVANAAAGVNFTTLSEVWTATLASKRLSFPRGAYRTICYKFSFLTASSQVLFRSIFNHFEEFFLGPDHTVEK